VTVRVTARPERFCRGHLRIIDLGNVCGRLAAVMKNAVKKPARISGAYLRRARTDPQNRWERLVQSDVGPA
jgi:hypothetical protein